MVSAKEMCEGNIKPNLDKGELLRLSLLRDGVVLSRDDKEPAVEDPICAIGAALGTYVANSGNIDVKDALVDLVRTYKIGYDWAKKRGNSTMVNVLVDDETGDIKHIEKRGTIKKKINLEEYK